MKIEPFKPGHFAELTSRPSEACMRAVMNDPEHLNTVARFDSWTMRIGGRVVACAGLLPLWDGRYEAWAVVASDIGCFGMLRLHRAAVRYLDLRTERRIEATVMRGFEQGQKWVRLLGFECETPNGMRGYLPGGETADLFSRVQ
jgi:hypothetical protein